MGSGYNDSLAVSRGARGKASTRTPIHFYLEVPMYEYDLGCGRNEHLHTFQSRTPLIASDDGKPVMVWCSGCQEFREITSEKQPLNRPISTDEVVGFEQDKGIIRERIALDIQDLGFIDKEEDFIALAVKHGVKISEVKRLNAGLRAPEGLSGLPDMCAKGLHEMNIDNIIVTNGRRKCRACWNAARRERRSKGKKD